MYFHPTKQKEICSSSFAAINAWLKFKDWVLKKNWKKSEEKIIEAKTLVGEHTNSPKEKEGEKSMKQYFWLPFFSSFPIFLTIRNLFLFKEVKAVIDFQFFHQPTKFSEWKINFKTRLEWKGSYLNFLFVGRKFTACASK